MSYSYISVPIVTDDPEAQSYVDYALKRLYEKMHWVFDPPPIPDRKFEFEDHLVIARTMRQMMDDNNKEKCCCVCSRRRRNIDFVTPLPNLADIPNLSLLLADGEKTPELPRDAKTIVNFQGEDYCLQRLGLDVPDEGVGGQVKARICKSCINDLNRGRVPKESLVSIDTGSYLDIPSKWTGGHDMYLKPLTHFEENIVAINRSFRCIYMMRAYGGQHGQWHMRGHVIAFQNNDINDVTRCFPMSFEEIPDNMQAIFISVLTENQSIADLIKKSPAFRINGVNLARWALYLAHMYKDVLGDRVNEKVIHEYRTLEQGQMPSSFVESAHVARHEADARVLAEGLMGGKDGRHGYANAFNDIDADEIVRAGMRPNDFVQPDESDKGENDVHPPYIE